MSPISRKEADAYDRILDAAARLAALVSAAGVCLEEDLLEEVTIFLAQQAPEVRRILRGVGTRSLPGE